MVIIADGEDRGEHISTLAKNRPCAKIILLASRLWDSVTYGRSGQSGQSPGIDAVGIDEEGNAIHVVIDRQHAAKYRDLLKEGEVYVFANVGCVPAAHYRPIMRSERLRINFGSEVQLVEEFNGAINRHYFEFQSYENAAKRVDQDTYLTDLVGVITKIEDPRGGYTRHGEGTRTKFYIQDLSGKAFPITLWGDLSLQFRQHHLLDSNTTTVAVVCSLSIRRYAGEIHGSSMSPTKFYLNLPLPEVASLLARYEPMKMVPQLLVKNSSATSFTNVVSEAVQTRTIDQLIAGPSLDVKPGQRYNCIGTLIGFEVDHGWFYTACRKCHKKLPPPDSHFGCLNCNLPRTESTLWYRLECVVEDISGTAVFTMFGPTGEKLIGAPVSLLASSRTMDPQVIHPLMERAIGKTRMFQVTLKQNTFGDCNSQIMVQTIIDVPKPKSDEDNSVVEAVEAEAKPQDIVVVEGEPNSGISDQSSNSVTESKKRVLPDSCAMTEVGPCPASKKAQVQDQELLKIKKGKMKLSEAANLVHETAVLENVTTAGSEHKVVVPYTKLKPILKILQSPLFDKLDATKEVELANLRQHLIEIDQPISDGGKKKKSKSKGKRSVSKSDISDVVKDAAAGNALEDAQPLSQLFRKDDIDVQKNFKKTGITVAKSISVMPKKGRGRPKSANKP